MKQTQSKPSKGDKKLDLKWIRNSNPEIEMNPVHKLNKVRKWTFTNNAKVRLRAGILNLILFGAIT